MIKPKKTLENIKPYSIDKYYTDCNLKLDSNENPYGPSPSVIQAIRNFDPVKIKHYPAYGELIDKLAELTGASFDNFILTNGCDEAISVIINTFLEENDVVLSYSPTFSMPKLYCDCIGAKFEEIPYKEKWAFDFDTFVSKITDKVKILYLTTPNNPTGDIISFEIVEKLAKTYPNKLVLLDCTYFNYAEISQNDYFGIVKKFDNVALLKSFSKDYALAGLRLGYIFAHPSIINEAKKVISPYSVNAVALEAGLCALSSREYFSTVREKIKKSKEILVSKLNEAGFLAYNTEANFILCDFGKYADFIYNKFLNAGIKVKYFRGIKGLENTFRIVAPRLEDIEKVCSVFAKRPLFVFDLDGVVFDVKNSYRLAIKKTFEYFTSKTCSDFDVQQAKNLGGMSNDWDLTYYLIEKAGVKVDYNELINVFQDFFFVSDRTGSKGLIDNEENVFKPEFFEELTKYADCAVFTGRPKDEAFYSLEKFGLKKYFSYFICNEDVEGNHKPSPFGLNKIKDACRYSDIFYFGDTVDDIKAGIDASVKVYGVIPPNATGVDETKHALKEFGANGVFENPEAILSELIKGNVLCN